MNTELLTAEDGLTEADLINWARRIKEEKGLTLPDIANDISYLFGRGASDPLSTAYISNALNPKGAKTNGVKISSAIIKHYEGIDINPQPYFKVA